MSTVEKPGVQGGETAAAASAKPKGRFRVQGLWHTAGPLAVFVVLLVVVAVLQPSFLGGGGLKFATTQATPIVLVALGQAAGLLVGSIGLSNAARGLLAAVGLSKAPG